MAENSKIEWTDHTFNPWMGCTKVSPACDNCYAEVQTGRFKQVGWGPHAPRKRTSNGYWEVPMKWNRKAEGAENRPRVFCASLADVFDNHKSILPEWREDLWQLIRSTPNLDWLLLTKRPQNIERYLPADWGEGWINVWLGTTVENQTEAERRISQLLNVPASIRFLSCEPLLGSLDLTPWLWGAEPPCKNCPRDVDCQCGWELRKNLTDEIAHGKIDWVIAGGESGSDFRPGDPNWFRSLRDQCADAEVPFLFKQWEGRSQSVIKGKGRELDGVIHNGYPAPKQQ